MQRHVETASDVDQDALGTLHRVIFQQRVGNRRFSRDAAAVGPLGLSSAHHRLAHLAHDGADVGEVEIDETRHHHEIGHAAHTHVQHVVGHLEGVREGRLLVGDFEQVLVGNDDQRVDHLLQFQDALLRRLHAAAALEVEGLGHDADGKDALLPRGCRDNGRRTGAGTTAHAGGDEHHVGTVEKLQDFRQRLFRGLATDFGTGAGAQSLGDGDAKLHTPVGKRLAKCLGISIGDDELHAFQRGADHVVDGVSARATDSNDGDTRLNLRLLLREAEVDCHSAFSTQTRGVSARSSDVGPF